MVVPAVAEACSAAEACFAAETKPVSRVTSHQIGQVTHHKADARMPAADAAAAAAAVSLSVAATSADTTGSANGQIQQTQIGPEQLELSTSVAPAAQSHPEAAEPPAAAAACCFICCCCSSFCWYSLLLFVLICLMQHWSK